MTRALALVVAALAVLAAAAPAPASEQSPTLAELERELVCPTCETTLAMSNNSSSVGTAISAMISSTTAPAVTLRSRLSGFRMMR